MQSGRRQVEIGFRRGLPRPVSGNGGDPDAERTEAPRESTSDSTEAHDRHGLPLERRCAIGAPMRRARQALLTLDHLRASAMIRRTASSATESAFAVSPLGRWRRRRRGGTPDRCPRRRAPRRRTVRGRRGRGKVEGKFANPGDDRHDHLHPARNLLHLFRRAFQNLVFPETPARSNSRIRVAPRQSERILMIVPLHMPGARRERFAGRRRIGSSTTSRTARRGAVGSQRRAADKATS